MPLLYLETNFMLGAATGRAPEVADFLARVPPAVKLALPQISIMEAFSAANAEGSRANEFQQQLRERIYQIRQWQELPDAADLRARLEESILLGGRVINEMQARLIIGTSQLVAVATLIPLLADVIQAAVANPVCRQTTDNLILHVITDHASRESEPVKAFYTQNLTDFTLGGGEAALRAAGVAPLLGDLTSVYQWFASL